jgi:hypothetical protein
MNDTTDRADSSPYLKVGASSAFCGDDCFVWYNYLMSIWRGWKFH